MGYIVMPEQIVSRQEDGEKKDKGLTPEQRRHLERSLKENDDLMKSLAKMWESDLFGILSKPILYSDECAVIFGYFAQDCANHFFRGWYPKAASSQDVVGHLKSCPLLAVVKRMKGYQMKSKSGLFEAVLLIVNPGDEIINGALAQDAG
jgi:hypothetical protein